MRTEKVLLIEEYNSGEISFRFIENKDDLAGRIEKHNAAPDIKSKARICTCNDCIIIAKKKDMCREEKKSHFKDIVNSIEQLRDEVYEMIEELKEENK